MVVYRWKNGISCNFIRNLLSFQWFEPEMMRLVVWPDVFKLRITRCQCRFKPFTLAPGGSSDVGRCVAPAG